MKIKCTHGYFEFEESRAGEVSDFVSIFGLELVRKGGVFTFADLEDAPDYSIEGGQVLGATAIKTFEGTPAEVFEQNELVYNYDQGLVVPIAEITQIVTIEQAGKLYVSDGLIMPGSLTRSGDRVKGYAGWFNRERMRFLYSEVSYA